MFRFCNSKEEIKKLYRELSKLLHPDKGGDHDLFVRLTHAYEFSIDELEGKNPSSKFNKETTMKSEDVIFALDNPDLRFIKKIYAFSNRNKKFSLDFTHSVLEFGGKHGYITSHQYNSLLKIYTAFRIDKENFTEDEIGFAECWFNSVF